MFGGPDLHVGGDVHMVADDNFAFGFGELAAPVESDLFAKNTIAADGDPARVENARLHMETTPLPYLHTGETIEK